MQNNGEAANCMGYALDLETDITADKLNIKVKDLHQKSISYIHSFYVSKMEEWMDIYIGSRNPARIFSSTSGIGLNQYRLVNRTGFQDKEIRDEYGAIVRPLNNQLDKPSGFWDELNDNDELFDNHWWYQTNTGYWAEKPSKTEPSNRIPVYNPSNESYWWNFSHFDGRLVLLQIPGGHGDVPEPAAA